MCASLLHLLLGYLCECAVLEVLKGVIDQSVLLGDCHGQLSRIVPFLVAELACFALAVLPIGLYLRSRLVM